MTVTAVTLVTGAGSGIGAGVAKRFAKEGSKVIVADLFLESAQKVVDEIKAEGGEAVASAMNVANEEQVKAGFQLAKDIYGKCVDILISNAGIQHIDPVDELSFDNWRKVIGVHLDGSFLCAKYAMQGMKEQKSGAILFTGSVHSKLASVLKAPYVTAKHGVLGLCKVIAKEGAEFNITSNVVCPGFVRTPLVEKQIPEQAAKLQITEDEVIKNVMLKDTVTKEFVTVEEVADTFLYLAAFPSGALTGQSMIVSGGWNME